MTDSQGVARGKAQTIAPEMTDYQGVARGKAQRIASDANYLADLIHDRDMRLTNAADAGAALAVEVSRFIEEPEAVGTDALYRAHQAFIGQHSANFTDSAREATPPSCHPVDKIAHAS